MNWLLSKLFPPRPKYLVPINPASLHISERRPELFPPTRPAGFLETYRWITNYQERPKVRGGLWRMDGRR